MRKEGKKVSKNEKRVAEAFALIKIEEDKNFEKYFCGLYNSLTKRYEQELTIHLTFTDRIDFIQSLMDEITEALHNARNNFNLSVLAEKQTQALKNLKNLFEQRLNELYSNNIESNDLNRNTNLFEHHPEYNPSFFNEKGYELFKYLIENYVKGKEHGISTRCINIWHFFNNELVNNPIYKKHKELTVEEYKKLVKHYKIDIKNVDKKPAYENKHLSILNSHFSKF